MISTRRSSLLFGLSLCAFALGAGCGLTGASTRAVSSGPPGSTGQASAATPAAPTWTDTCGPAPMMSMDTINGWGSAVGPCYDRKAGLDSNGQEYKPVPRPGLEYFKGQHGPLVKRLVAAKNGMSATGGRVDLVAAVDYQAQSICFAAFPAGQYNPATVPTSSVMECSTSAEFPKRWLRSLQCEGGSSCDFDLFVVCQQAPCKVGAVGIMPRPKDGPG